LVSISSRPSSLVLRLIASYFRAVKLFLATLLGVLALGFVVAVVLVFVVVAFRALLLVILVLLVEGLVLGALGINLGRYRLLLVTTNLLEIIAILILTFAVS